jgi:dihydrofolate synthase/folylpolyglutamate synthase
VARLSPEAALAHLAGRSPSSIKMGLGRVQDALARLGHPERRVPALHVAGTNGKGSTSAMAAACLGTRYRTGLYTSPHLVRVNERWRIDGVDLDDVTLGRSVADVVEVLGVDHELTYFELGTIVAFHAFAEARVDLAVLEVGLGGRLDATSACTPLVTCITPVSFDHMEYLGHTLGAIAAEKAGIIRRQVPLVVGAQAPEALEVIQRLARDAEAPVWLEGRDFRAEARGHGLAYEGPGGRWSELPRPLAGPHQVHNQALALACLEVMAGRGFPLSEQELARGLASTRWPGRLEVVDGVLLDGAHNPAGVEVLLAALPEIARGRPVHLVFGVLADKDSAPMMRALFPMCASVSSSPLPSPRSRAPAEYAALARSLCADVTIHESPLEALTAARARADGLVLVAGSLVLVGEARRHLSGVR